MKKIINTIVILSMASLLMAACSSAATPTLAPAAVSSNEVVAEGRVEPVHGTNLSFQARGIVEAVLVKSGDSVKQGDVLVRLANAGGAEAQVVLAQNAYDLLLRDESGDRARLWTAYMDAQKKRADAQKKWDDLNVDDIETRIDDAQNVVEDRQTDLSQEQKNFDKYKDLPEKDDQRKNAKDKLDTAQENLNSAIRDLEKTQRERDTVRAALDAALSVEAEAKHQYEISLDGPNKDQLALAKANLDAAKDTLSNFVLTAPFDGTVADVNVKVGEEVGPETRAVSISDSSSWFVETTDVTELEVVHLVVGQQVSLIPDALPDLTLTGTVTEISNAYTQQGGDILYTVRIHIDTPDERLRWGMTVEATFADVQQ